MNYSVNNNLFLSAKPIRAGHTPQVNHASTASIRGGGMQPYQPPAAHRRMARE